MPNDNARLHSLLRQNVETARGPDAVELDRWQSAIVSQADIFTAFMRSKLDYKGALVSGLSAEGFRGSTRVSVNLGTLAPGLKAGGKLSFSGQMLNTSLLVVSRQPKKLGTVSTTAKPVSFACMRGAAARYQITLEGQVGVGTPEIPGKDALQAAAIEITLEAKLAAKASLTVAGERLFLRDPAVRFYAGPEDPMLATDFNMLIGPGSKADIKADILKFFQDQRAIRHLAPKKDLRRRITGGGIPRADLDAALREALLYVQGPTALAEEERTFLVNNLAYRRALLQAYEAYNVEHFLTARLEHTRGEAEAAMRETNTSRGLGRSQEQVRHTTAFTLNRNAKLCFLDLCSNEGGASASLEAKMEASLSTGYKQELGDEDQGAHLTIGEMNEAEGPDVELKAGLEVGAKVGIDGKYKRTSYRYQTYARAANPVDVLVATQDTIITYKQVKLGAEVSGSIGATASVLGRERAFVKEGKKNWEKKVYNAMSYESAVLYWMVPGMRVTDVQAEVGSGYAFGESQLAQTLLGYLDGYIRNGQTRGVYADPDPDAVAYLGKLAKALRISTPELVEMLNACRNSMVAISTRSGRGSPTNPSGVTRDHDAAVILESVFAIPGDGRRLAFKIEHSTEENRYEVRLEADADGAESFRKKMRKLFDGPVDARPPLQALRLRVRRADQKADCAIKFKLGFNLNGTGLGIELAKVEKAGCEAVVDLFTHWYGNYARFNVQGSDAARLRAMGVEEAVPPTALLHQ